MKQTKSNLIRAALKAALLTLRVTPAAEHVPTSGVEFSTIEFSGGYLGLPDSILELSVAAGEDPSTHCVVNGVTLENNGDAAAIAPGLLAAVTWTGNVGPGTLTLDFSDEDACKVNVIRVYTVHTAALTSDVFPFAVVSPPINNYDEGPHEFRTVKQRRVIQWWVEKPADADDSLEQVCDQALAWLKKKLVMDDPQLGGLVYESKLVADEHFVFSAAKDFVGVQIEVEYQYQEPVDNPFS